MGDIQDVSEGLRKQRVKSGSGPKVVAGKTITVSCTGSVDVNPPKKFWSTSDPGQKPFTFKVGVGQVIAGWDEGCLTMCQGERSRLYIASHKGYGSGGFPAWGIPPNGNLIFEIEILSISD